MRLFWSLFFLGSLLLLSFDVVERRQAPEQGPERAPGISSALGDPWAPPTPNP